MLLSGQIDGYFFAERTTLQQSEVNTKKAEPKSSQVLSKEKKIQNRSLNNG